MEPKYVRYLASLHRLFQYVSDNFIEIPNCGHLAMLEQPDAVADHIRSLVIGNRDQGTGNREQGTGNRE
jgi:pimeloyl-ACP methyl ester carboxylesterase